MHEAAVSNKDIMAQCQNKPKPINEHDSVSNDKIEHAYERIKSIMRLSVHGSRGLSDERVKIILMEEIEEHGVTVVVTHAEPGGVCEVARALCKEKAIPLKLHFLNFRYLRGAFEHRSKDVLRDADRAVFIHDGQSKGTSNEKRLADRMKIPYSFHELEPAQHEKSNGFDPDEAPWNIDLGLEMPTEPLIEMPTPIEFD